MGGRAEPQQEDGGAEVPHNIRGTAESKQERELLSDRGDNREDSITEKKTVSSVWISEFLDALSEQHTVDI